MMAIGCTVAVKQPIYLSPEFQFSSLGEIVILYPVDLRIDKKIKVNLEKQLQNKSAKILSKRGYQITNSVNMEMVEEITDIDLKDAKPEWIKELGPEDARWVMVICLVDVTTKLTFGSTGNAEITGFLYDKENGQMIWRDKGIGQVGQGGLAGMLMKGSMDESAINNALYNLLASIPNR